MKKLYICSLALFFLVSFTACSEIAMTDGKTAGEMGRASKLLSNEEFKTMLSNPEQYVGDQVEFFARVFFDLDEEYLGGRLYEAHVDISNEKKVLLILNDEQIKEDDIIAVKGQILDVYKGEGLIGKRDKMPIIKVESAKLSDYTTAFAPAVKKLDLNLKINQHNYNIAVEKLEIAAADTRVHVSITNQGKERFYFYKYDAKMAIGDKLQGIKDNYLADYEELPGIIEPGQTAKGILIFPKIAKSGKISIILEGYAADFNLKFAPYQFDISY